MIGEIAVDYNFFSMLNNLFRNQTYEHMMYFKLSYIIPIMIMHSSNNTFTRQKLERHVQLSSSYHVSIQGVPSQNVFHGDSRMYP